MRNASIEMEVEALTIVAWRMVICSAETEDSFFGFDMITSYLTPTGAVLNDKTLGTEYSPAEVSKRLARPLDSTATQYQFGTEHSI